MGAQWGSLGRRKGRPGLTHRAWTSANLRREETGNRLALVVAGGGVSGGSAVDAHTRLSERAHEGVGVKDGPLAAEGWTAGDTHRLMLTL